jgi:hypothetical protein
VTGEEASALFRRGHHVRRCRRSSACHSPFERPSQNKGKQRNSKKSKMAYSESVSKLFLE